MCAGGGAGPPRDGHGVSAACATGRVHRDRAHLGRGGPLSGAAARLARPARIAVVGVSASGKSTVARRIALHLQIPHVELDSLWHDAGWQNPTPEEFVARVNRATADEEWVCDGNYAAARELVWSRATAVVWLDFARWVGPLRAVRRTARRIVTREPLWNDNREQWWTVLSAEHPIRWSWSKHPSTRASYAAMFADPAHSHLQLVRLRSPREARSWLVGVERSEQTT